ncbi:MAG: DUF2057 domain-containing protein [Moraxellaceae bacterium]|nr:DUF2057 domain-containing protein [Moraxellaceae bacterium]
MKLITYKKLPLVVLLSIASSFTYAEVTLDVEDNIKVTAINGQAVNKGLFSRDKTHFNLQAGKHVITARYDRMFNLSRDKHDYVKSGNITITADLADNKNYKLVMPNQPKGYTQAKEYAQNPTLAIKLGNQTLASQSNQIAETGLFAKAEQKFSSLFNKNNAVNDNAKVIASIAQNKPQATTDNTEKSTLDQFMQIWLKATPAERERIRAWIAK